jgi:hypothetical protein
MDSSGGDWGLEAVVRSCVGGSSGAVDVPSSEAAEPPPVAAPCREVTLGCVAPVQPVRAAASSSPLYDVLEYLDLEHEQLSRAPFSITPSSAREREVLISFPAASTSGQPLPATTRKQAGRKPSGRAHRPKRRYTSWL